MPIEQPTSAQNLRPAVGTGAAMVSTIEASATEAALQILREGGNAIDAAITANAVLSVTAQNMCGIGGDLLAIIYDPGRESKRPEVTTLNSSGRSSRRASASRLKSEGLRKMPRHGRIESVTVPGCVDGWIALSERFGTLPLERLLDSAITLAETGFASSALLAEDAEEISHLKGATEYRTAFKGGYATGTIVRRPGIAKVLRSIASSGRDAFYQGDFGKELIGISMGYFDLEDLKKSSAEWSPPVQNSAFGYQILSLPPTSQGGLTVASAAIAERIGLPMDPQDPQFFHILIESARLAGFDRDLWIGEGADFDSHFSESELDRRASMFNRSHRIQLDESTPTSGDTTALCVIDANGMGISLVQSNASGFGSLLFTPESQIFLHNRGIGFSLDESRPNFYSSSALPMHTLSPTLVTSDDSRLKLLTGTMGGDAQPQILLQLLATALHLGIDSKTAVSNPRFVFAPQRHSGSDGFSTWDSQGEVTVLLEPTLSVTHGDSLKSLGHRVVASPRSDSTFGHAHMIKVESDAIEGFADPRSLGGLCAGI